MYKGGEMRNKWAIKGFLGCLVLLAGVLPAPGKSVYGKVTEVRSADVVVFNYGTGQYTVHIIGIDAPSTDSLANEAKQFVSKLVLGKNVNMRLGSRTPNGEMVSQIYTDDPATGIKDVGLELVRAGLARRKPGDEYTFGYKYGELSAAEKEAQRARRGMWSETQPK